MKRVLIVFLFSIFSCQFLFAQIEWTPAKTGRLLNDYVGVLQLHHRNELEQRLRNFCDSTSTQIAVVIVDNLHGDDILNMAQRIGDSWGVGQKDVSNGLVLLIKVRSEFENFGEVAIATGYGLEAAFPDVFCSRIIQDYMVGYLQDDDFYRAISSALDIIEPVASGEYSYAQFKKSEQKEIFLGLGFLVHLIIVLVIVGVRYGKNHPGSFGGGHGHGALGSGDVWMSPPFGSRGSFGSSGGFGGFGGGGFGGARGRF